MKALLVLGVGVAGAFVALNHSEEQPVTDVLGDSDNEDFSLAETDMTNSNLDAMLAVIREGESSDDYSALVGGGSFEDLSDHPAVTGEFKGIKRGDTGQLTTAAGAYQITRTTWLDLGGKAKYGSFDDAAQDAAAVDLIRRRNAYDAIMSGNIQLAIDRLRNEWEFLKKWDGARVAHSFINHGGTLA